MTFTDNLLMPKDKGGCFGWGWYMSNDFQFFFDHSIFTITLH